MRKTVFIFFLILTVLIVPSCGNGRVDGDDSILSSKIIEQTAVHSTDNPVTTASTVPEITQVQSVPASTKASFDNISELLLNEFENGNIYQDGTLYDLDLDGIPELIIIEEGMVLYFCDVYKLTSKGKTILGHIILNDGNEYGESLILDLYYDTKDSIHFYCSYPIDFVKNQDGFYEGSYGTITAELFKYIVSNENIISSSLLRQDWDYEYDDDITDKAEQFYNECSKILLKYEKMKTISLSPMWTYEDIRSGAYEQIIRDYFKDNGIAE